MDISGLAEHLAGQKNDVSWWQMSIRGVIVFAYGLLLVRFPGQRIFGKALAYDIVLAVLVGSNLSRALTGNSPFIAMRSAGWRRAAWCSWSRTATWIGGGISGA